MPDFRRGREALEESARQAEESKGSFRPFAPNLTWNEADEEHFVVFLNDIDDVVKILEHRFISIGTYEKADGTKGTRYGFYLARTDPAIGEDTDPLIELGRDPQERYLATAVELEPVYGEKKGRGGQRPVGFEVATDTYNKRIDPDDDDSETEEVEYPLIGLIDQAYQNFFTFISSHAESDGPIQDCAFRVKRIGKGTDTTYSFTPFFDAPIEFGPLFNNLDGLSYLSDDDEKFGELIAEVEEALESGDDDADLNAALTVGNALLNRRLDELADKERYDEEVADLTPEDVKSKFGDKDKKKKESKGSGSKAKRGGSRSKAKSEDDGDKRGGSASEAKFAEVKRRAAERRAKREAADKD